MLLHKTLLVNIVDVNVQGNPSVLNVKVSFLVMIGVTEPFKKELGCSLWLWREPRKSNPDDLMMLLGLSRLGCMVDLDLK